MRMPDKINYWAGSLQPTRSSAMAVLHRAGTLSFEQNVAYIHALEPLKPLVSFI